MSYAIHGIKALHSMINSVKNEFDSKMRKGFLTTIFHIENESKRLIRDGYYKAAIDNGIMINAFTHKIITMSYDYMEAEIGNSKHYSYIVHEGKGWHKSPRRFLKDAIKNTEKRRVEMFWSGFVSLTTPKKSAQNNNLT